MATLMSRATGNLTDSTTWALVDSTSLNPTGSTSVTLTTSYQQSTAFTPGAIIIDGIAVFVGSRVASPTGTITIGLFQAGSLVTGTDVTINVSDLPNYNTFVTGVGIGWIFFKLPSPVTLSAATAYTVGAKTSNSTQVVLITNSVTNWLRSIRTTTTQAPVAADNLMVCGEWTGAGSATSLTVTMNETATTAYGQIDVCDHGIFLYGNAASTNYYLKTKDVFVRANGIMRIGTSGTPIPSSSSAVLELASASAAQYGLAICSLGVFETYGASKKSWTDLTANVAVAATSMSVTDNTNWAINDDVIFSPTARTYTQFEKRTIATVGTNTFTVSAGTTFAHTGTGTYSGQSLAGQVGNLTRNIKIRGMSTTNTGYVRSLDTATFSSSYTEFYNLGGFVAPKTGICAETTTGSFVLNHCAMHDYASAQANGVQFSSSLNNWNVNDCVFYSNQILTAIHISTTTTNTNMFATNNLIIGWGTGILIDNPFNITVTGNRISGNSSGGITFSSGLSTVDYTGTFSNNIVSTTGSVGVTLGLTARSIVLGATTTYFSASYNLLINGTFTGTGVVINDLNTFGGTSNIGITANINGYCTMNNCVLNNHSTFASSVGILLISVNTVNKLIIKNSNFGNILAHSTADIDVSNVGSSNDYIELSNVNLNTTTEVAGQTALGYLGYISSQKHDQTNGLHKIWKRFGTILTDSTIYDSVSPSMRLIPNNATFKLQGGKFQTPVVSAGTVSLSIKVRKSVVGDGAAYNGNQPRLILLANPAAGIDTDVVIGTATNAANGAWEIISGTTSSVTDNAVLEFVVDCDGTAGWVNVDTFSMTSSAVNTAGLSYWSYGQPVVLAGNITSGGGSSSRRLVR